MIENDWKWLKMIENDWQWLKMNEMIKVEMSEKVGNFSSPRGALCE